MASKKLKVFSGRGAFNTKLKHDKLLDSILGTIYGNCVGDAIGLLTEFMSKPEATNWYGDEKELELDMKKRLNRQGYRCHQSRWKTGDWTDDSDQMILILQSIIDNKGKVDPTDFAKKMLDWADHGFPELGDTGGLGIGNTTYQVLNHKDFKGPKPYKAAEAVWKSSGCFLAPNGAVMRTSILGIHNFDDMETVVNNTKKICKTTHADPRCAASCVAVTSAIAMMLKGDRHRGLNGEVVAGGIIEDAFHEAKKCLSTDTEKNELHWYMNVEKIDELDLDESAKIGYTYKCLGAAFWAFKQNDFRQALTTIVREAGDADTNGAVAGALLGCKLGFQKLPKSWTDGLLHKKWLEAKIKQFFEIKMGSLVKQMTETTAEQVPDVKKKPDDSEKQETTPQQTEQVSNLTKEMTDDLKQQETTPSQTEQVSDQTREMTDELKQQETTPSQTEQVSDQTREMTDELKQQETTPPQTEQVSELTKNMADELKQQEVTSEDPEKPGDLKKDEESTSPSDTNVLEKDSESQLFDKDATTETESAMEVDEEEIKGERQNPSKENQEIYETQL